MIIPDNFVAWYLIVPNVPLTIPTLEAVVSKRGEDDCIDVVWENEVIVTNDRKRVKIYFI